MFGIVIWGEESLVNTTTKPTHNNITKVENAIYQEIKKGLFDKSMFGPKRGKPSTITSDEAIKIYSSKVAERLFELIPDLRNRDFSKINWKPNITTLVRQLAGSAKSDLENRETFFRRWFDEKIYRNEDFDPWGDLKYFENKSIIANAFLGFDKWSDTFPKVPVAKSSKQGAHQPSLPQSTEDEDTLPQSTEVDDIAMAKTDRQLKLKIVPWIVRGELTIFNGIEGSSAAEIDSEIMEICKKFETNCTPQLIRQAKQNLSLILPPAMAARLGQGVPVHGPNCFNTALFINGVIDEIRFVGNKELEFILKTFCQYSEFPISSSGAIGIFRSKSEKTIEHAFIPLTQNIAFEKPSNSKTSYYRLSSVEQMLDLEDYRNNVDVEYYNCDKSSEKYQSITNPESIADFESPLPIACSYGVCRADDIAFTTSAASKSINALAQEVYDSVTYANRGISSEILEQEQNKICIESKIFSNDFFIDRVTNLISKKHVFRINLKSEFQKILNEYGPASSKKSVLSKSKIDSINSFFKSVKDSIDEDTSNSNENIIRILNNALAEYCRFLALYEIKSGPKNKPLSKPLVKIAQLELNINHENSREIFHYGEMVDLRDNFEKNIKKTVNEVKVFEFAPLVE